MGLKEAKELIESCMGGNPEIVEVVNTLEPNQIKSAVSELNRMGFNAEVTDPAVRHNLYTEAACMKLKAVAEQAVVDGLYGLGADILHIIDRHIHMQDK